jgi:hypothetical protein
LAFCGAVHEFEVLAVDITKLGEAFDKFVHETHAVLAAKQREIGNRDGLCFLRAGAACHAEQRSTTQHGHERAPIRHASSGNPYFFRAIVHSASPGMQVWQTSGRTA